MGALQNISQNPYVSLGTGMIQSGGNFLSQLMANQANKDLAQMQFDQQKELINMQNEYNSPSAQMQRYKDAGLNANLMYGSITPGNQSNIANYQRPDMKAPEISLPDLVSIANNVEDVKNKKLQGDLLYDEHLGRMLENSWKAVLYGYDPGMVMTEEDRNKIRESPYFQLMTNRINNYSEQWNTWKNLRSFRDATAEISRDKYKLDKSIFDYRKDEYWPKQIELWEAQIKSMPKEWQRSLDSISGAIGTALNGFSKFIPWTKPAKLFSPGIGRSGSSRDFGQGYGTFSTGNFWD